MMMALLNNNADIFIRNNQGYSPIYFAASVAEAEVVDTMIRACGDFDVNAPLNTHGHTLLHVAAKNNNVDLIRVLLQKDGIKAHALDQCVKHRLILLPNLITQKQFTCCCRIRKRIHIQAKKLMPCISMKKMM